MLTASYISPDMQALDKEAKESGILILNELGLEPVSTTCRQCESLTIFMQKAVK